MVVRATRWYSISEVFVHHATGEKLFRLGAELLAEAAKALVTSSSVTSWVSGKKPGSGAGVGLGWGGKK